MQRLGVSGAVRPLYGSLGVKGLKADSFLTNWTSYFIEFSVPLELFGNIDTIYIR